MAIRGAGAGSKPALSLSGTVSIPDISPVCRSWLFPEFFPEKYLIFGGKFDFHIDHIPGSSQDALFIVSSQRDILRLSRWIGYVETEIGTQILFSLDCNFPATIGILQNGFHDSPPIISLYFSFSSPSTIKQLTVVGKPILARLVPYSRKSATLFSTHALRGIKSTG
jgi:hypothetical protein